MKVDFFFLGRDLPIPPCPLPASEPSRRKRSLHGIGHSSGFSCSRPRPAERGSLPVNRDVRLLPPWDRPASVNQRPPPPSHSRGEEKGPTRPIRLFTEAAEIKVENETMAEITPSWPTVPRPFGVPRSGHRRLDAPLFSPSLGTMLRQAWYWRKAPGDVGWADAPPWPWSSPVAPVLPPADRVLHPGLGVFRVVLRLLGSRDRACPWHAVAVWREHIGKKARGQFPLTLVPTSSAVCSASSSRPGLPRHRLDAAVPQSRKPPNSSSPFRDVLTWAHKETKPHSTVNPPVRGLKSKYPRQVKRGGPLVWKARCGACHVYPPGVGSRVWGCPFPVWTSVRARRG